MGSRPAELKKRGRLTDDEVATVIRYLETFFRNRWLVAIPALLLAFSGAGLVITAPKQFTAGSTIWTEASAYLDLPRDPNRYATPAQIQDGRLSELLKTYSFTRSVVDKTSVGKTGTELEKDTLVAQIQQNLHISDSGEHTIQISFTHKNPELAVAVVKTVIEQYNQVTADSANLQANEAIKFYQERVQTYATQVLPASNKAVTDYLDAHPEVRQNQREGGPADPQLAQLQQQAQADRNQYEQYQQKLDDILTQSQAVAQHQEVAFRVMDPPGLIGDSSGKLPKKKMLVYAGAGAGVSIGYVALFLILASEIDHTLRNAGDVRYKLHLPVLEVIPDYSMRGTRRLRKRNKGQIPQDLAHVSGTPTR